MKNSSHIRTTQTKLSTSVFSGTVRSFVGTGIASLALFAHSAMADVPHQFQAGTPAKASEVNANFDHLTVETQSNAAAIGSNAGAISSNAGAISSNASAISSNAGAVSSNASAISSNASAISANTGAISSNSGSISSNTNGITANASDISANTTSIGVNATAIQSNATSISSQASEISSISSSVGSNTANISNNASGIVNNASAVAENGTAIGVNTRGISSNSDNISTNSTAISQNSSQLSSQSSSISSNAQGVADNASAISNNFQSIANNTANASDNASLIGDLQTSVTDLQNNQDSAVATDTFLHGYAHNPQDPEIGTRTTYASEEGDSYTEVVRFPLYEFGAGEAYALTFPVTVAFCPQNTDCPTDETYIAAGSFKTYHAVADSGVYPDTFSGLPARIEISTYRNHGVVSNFFTGQYYYTMVDVATAQVTVKINETKLVFTISNSEQIDFANTTNTDRDLVDNVDWNEFGANDALVAEVISTLNNTSIERLVDLPETPM